MNEPIRVLHVLDKIDTNSGVSSVVMNYYRFMDRSKVIFDFMVHEPVSQTLVKKINQQGSHIYYMPPLHLSNLFIYRKELISFFKEHKEYKIVHGHVANASAFYLSAARKSNVPIRIIHSHNSRGADTLLKKARNFILNKIGVHNANKFIACSEKAGYYLFGKKRMHNHQVKLLKNAINIEEFCYNKIIRDKIRKELGLTDQMLIGHVGRFCEQKNHNFLIDIFNDLHAANKNSILILLGDGALRKKVQSKISQLHLEPYVLFMGSKENISDYFQAMDVLVLPSLYEGLPVVCIEAQASGLPCILSDTITKSVKVTSRTQFLSLSSNLNLWRAAILKCGEEELNQKYDRRCVAAQVISAGYDIRKNSKILEQLYRKFSYDNYM